MDRIPHDHPSLEHVRAEVTRHGGRRRRLELPPDVLPDENTVRVVLEESIRFGRIRSDSDADRDWLTGVFDGLEGARADGAATDRLQPWLRERDRNAGDSVHVDVIAPGYAIGLRAPGERAVYPAIDPPTGSLDAIARSLEDEP